MPERQELRSAPMQGADLSSGRGCPAAGGAPRVRTPGEALALPVRKSGEVDLRSGPARRMHGGRTCPCENRPCRSSGRVGGATGPVGLASFGMEPALGSRATSGAARRPRPCGGSGWMRGLHLKRDDLVLDCSANDLLDSPCCGAAYAFVHVLAGQKVNQLGVSIIFDTVGPDRCLSGRG